MNRFKTELRKKGIKLDCDYPWMPYEVDGVAIQMVNVDSEKATYTVVANVGTFPMKVQRDGNMVPVQGIDKNELAFA